MMSGTVRPTGCRRRTTRHAPDRPGTPAAHQDGHEVVAVPPRTASPTAGTRCVPASGRSTLVALLALLGAGLLLLLGGSAIVLLILGYGHEAMSAVLPLLMVLLAAAVLPGPGRSGTRR